MARVGRTASPPIGPDTQQVDWLPGPVESIAAIAARHPDSVAVRCDGVTSTYAELLGRTASVKAHLVDAGITRGDVVGVLQSRGPMLVPSLLGVLAAGAGFLPLDGSYPQARLRRYAEVARPRVILSDEPNHALAASLCPSVIQPNDDCGCTLHTTDSSASNLAYVLFTSGSTGVPKGVAISNGALANFLHAMRERLGSTGADVMLAHTTVAFDISILELFLPLTVGATVLLATEAEAGSPDRLISLLGDCTMAQATPSLWRILTSAGWSPDQRLTVLSGGEAISLSLARNLASSAAAVWNLYGPTEATVWTSCAQVKVTDEVVPIGDPLPNTALHVLDANLQATTHGELYISGSGLAQGYLGDPVATARSFVTHPETGTRIYRTGDTVRVLDNGSIEWLGRSAAELKIRGNRIAPSEVERELTCVDGSRPPLSPAERSPALAMRCTSPTWSPAARSRRRRWTKLWPPACPGT